MPKIVSLKLRSDARRYHEDTDTLEDVFATYEDIDLDRLSPRARALAEAIAASPLRTKADIWMESDQPIRERTPDWHHWYTEERASQPERRSWRGWAKYPATSPTDPHRYLETEAAKIPPGWHVLGADPRTPVQPGADEQLMTRHQVLTYLASHGRVIKPGTWDSYVTRDQAPRPATRVGRTPLWSPADIAAFAAGTRNTSTEENT